MFKYSEQYFEAFQAVGQASIICFSFPVSAFPAPIVPLKEPKLRMTLTLPPDYQM
ncbi:hypothetical protein H6G50_04325 [Oscillatoria sp. FACHB-1406]|nr:hypothetical protein [Oscillatoria sp. FACHB-1406]